VSEIVPNTVILGDAQETLKKIPDSSADLVLTDPPYFLDKLDGDWDPQEVKNITQGQVIKNLPGGMRFDPDQGMRLQEWYQKISQDIFRVLKPGGFFLSFSSPRLVHRLAVAVEDAGFYIRDIFIWVYPEGRAKAQTLTRYTSVKDERLSYWKTPQVRGNYEPIVVAQKPPEGKLVDNFLSNGVGLFNFSERLEGNYFPSNVLMTEKMAFLPPIFLIPKPKKEERGDFNTHPTVKPLALLRYLIRLTTQKGAVVLDPFLGSGSTAVAALLEERKYIGIEINREYYQIAFRRIEKAKQEKAVNSTAQPLLL